MPKIIALLLLIILLPLQPAIAEQAKDFTLPTDKGEIQLSKLKGKIVYVDFWASWCVPCRKSFPWMNKMHAKYESQGLEIIAISLDDDEAMAYKFLKKMPALFTVAYDTKGTIAELYDVQVMPTSYLIDRNGKLLLTHKGFKTKHEDKMEAELVKALKQ